MRTVSAEQATPRTCCVSLVSFAELTHSALLAPRAIASFPSVEAGNAGAPREVGVGVVVAAPAVSAHSNVVAEREKVHRALKAVCSTRAVALASRHTATSEQSMAHRSIAIERLPVRTSALRLAESCPCHTVPVLTADQAVGAMVFGTHGLFRVRVCRRAVAEISPTALVKKQRILWRLSVSCRPATFHLTLSMAHHGHNLLFLLREPPAVTRRRLSTCSAGPGQRRDAIGIVPKSTMRVPYVITSWSDVRCDAVDERLRDDGLLMHDMTAISKLLLFMHDATWVATGNLS